MSRNRLAAATSPYLLQHADNPVDWYPWGREAFAEARRRDCPVLLSVGYAACHWCHVMAHESFEDPGTAELMNRLFVNVKVDREERPDVDRYYMKALHLMGQQGGWPLTMFLAPDGRPLWGGTYFPPRPRFGRPSFTQVLQEVARLWREDRDKLLGNAETLTHALNERLKATPGELPTDFSSRAAYALTDLFDTTHGGLSGAPKFPQVPLLRLMWRAGRAHERELVHLTLRHICQGGIYDHLDGGFARYSTDSNWLVPHFEKMLYDNALLLDALLSGWLDTEERLYRWRIEETVSFLFRRMQVPSAGFAASLDADSEGEEGRHYVWTWHELMETVSDRNRDLFFRVYDVSRRGNWEGKNILNRLHATDLLDEETETRLAEERSRLLTIREQRPWPARDDKVLAHWNGLVVKALANIALAFDDRDLLRKTQDIFAHLITVLEQDGVIHQSWNRSRSPFPATADGIAAMIGAALALHGATGKTRYLQIALRWQEDLDTNHFAQDEGAYLYTRRDADTLIGGQIFSEDEATPNYHAMIVENLARLAFYTGDEGKLRRAETVLKRFGRAMAENPLAHAALLAARHDLLHGARVTLIPGDSRETEPGTRELLDALFRKEREIVPVLHATINKASGSIARSQEATSPALVVCRGETCSVPIRNLGELDAAIG